MLLAAAGLGLAIGIVVGGFGGGGGVLTVPVLVYLLGQSAQSATTGSLVIVGITAVAGTIARAAAGEVRWPIGLAFGAVGIPAAWLGSLLNRHIPQAPLMLAFAAVALIAAAALLIDARRPVPEPDAPADGGVATAVRVRATVAKVVGLGLLIGFLTGLLGVGGGFLAVPALVIAVRLPIQAAIGTSLLVIVLNSAAGLASRLGSTGVDVGVVLPFALAAVVGTLLGKPLADRFSGPVLTTVFAGMLLAVGAVVALESVIALSA